MVYQGYWMFFESRVRIPLTAFKHELWKLLCSLTSIRVHFDKLLDFKLNDYIIYQWRIQNLFFEKKEGAKRWGSRGHKGGIMRCPLNLAMFTCMFITGDLLAWVESSDRYMKQPNLQVTRWISIKWCTCLHSSIPMIKMVCFIFLIMIYLSVLNTRLSLILKIGYPTDIIVKFSSFRAGNAIWNYIWYQR